MAEINETYRSHVCKKEGVITDILTRLAVDDEWKESHKEEHAELKNDIKDIGDSVKQILYTIICGLGAVVVLLGGVLFTLLGA